jgi:hypothetical protein
VCARREIKACCIWIVVTAPCATVRLILSVCPYSLSVINLRRLTSFSSSANVRLRTVGVDWTIESEKVGCGALTALAQRENQRKRSSTKSRSSGWFCNACLKRAKYLRVPRIDKSNTREANAETHWDRTVERVLKTTTPLSVFLRDPGTPGERSSQVRSFIIEDMHSRVVV